MSTPDASWFAEMAGRAMAAGFDEVKLASFDEMPRDLTHAAVIEGYTSVGLNARRGLDLARRMEPLNMVRIEEVTRRFRWRTRPRSIAGKNADGRQRALCQTPRGQRSRRFVSTLIGFDGQFQYREIIQTHLIILDFAGRARGAESPLLADDLLRRSTARG